MIEKSFDQIIVDRLKRSAAGMPFSDGQPISRLDQYLAQGALTSRAVKAWGGGSLYGVVNGLRTDAMLDGGRTGLLDWNMWKPGGVQEIYLTVVMSDIASGRLIVREPLNFLRCNDLPEIQMLPNLDPVGLEAVAIMVRYAVKNADVARWLDGGAALGAASSVPVMAYAKAEDASTQLQIAMMEKGGKVSEQFAQVDALAKKLGNALPGTTVDFQNMMTMLIRQGAEAKNVLGGLGEATANIGVLLKMSPEAAAEFSQQLQDATRTANQDMMGLMDTIQRTFNVGTKQDWMLQAFAKLSPALSVIKKEGLEAANAMAPLLAMANQNGMTDGGSAGNALRKIFQQSMSQDKREKGNAELKGTGVKIDFSNGKGEFGGLDKMFAQLEQLRSVSTEKRLAAIKAMFGDDAETLQVLSLMIDKGAAGYAEMVAKMEKQASIQERLERQKKTLMSLWETASGTFSNALVEFGESISPELHSMAESVGKMAEQVQKWAQENPQLAATLMTLAKWGAMVLLGVGALGLAIAAVSAPIAVVNLALAGMGLNLGMVFGGLSRVIGFVAKAVAANPLGLLFVAGAAAIGHILGRLDELKAKFNQGDWWGIGRVIMEGIIAGFDSLTFGLFSKVLDVIKGITTRIAKALGFNPFPSASGSGTGPAGETGGTSAPKIDVRPSIVPPQPRSAFAGGNNSFVFNIQPSPGMDERGLAGLVRDEFSKITREQGVRQRSSLRDQD